MNIFQNSNHKVSFFIKKLKKKYVDISIYYYILYTLLNLSATKNKMIDKIEFKEERCSTYVEERCSAYVEERCSAYVLRVKKEYPQFFSFFKCKLSCCNPKANDCSDDDGVISMTE
jgi:hypothetical protein